MVLTLLDTQQFFQVLAKRQRSKKQEHGGHTCSKESRTTPATICPNSKHVREFGHVAILYACLNVTATSITFECPELPTESVFPSEADPKCNPGTC